MRLARLAGTPGDRIWSKDTHKGRTRTFVVENHMERPFPLVMAVQVWDGVPAEEVAERARVHTQCKGHTSAHCECSRVCVICVGDQARG